MSSTLPFLMLEKKLLVLPDEELIRFIRLYSGTHQGEKPYRHTYIGGYVILNRGDVAKSLSKLAELWGISIDRVRGMLDRWEGSGFISKRVVGKGKNSISVISMYNIKVETTHNNPREKTLTNKDVMPEIGHNKPQQNKEIINKEINKDTKVLNPEIFQFGLIPFEEIKEFLVEGDINIPPMRYEDFNNFHREELLDIFTNRTLNKRDAANDLFLYAYIKHLNNKYLPNSSARYWKMDYDDYENIYFIKDSFGSFKDALIMISVIFGKILGLEKKPKNAATSYFASIIEKGFSG